MIEEDKLLDEAKELFEINKKAYGKKLRHGEKSLEIEYEDIAIQSPEIADNLIERPYETIQLLEIGLGETTWTKDDMRIRLLSIPSDQEILIRNLRSKHLGKMLCINGVIRRASEIRPIVTNIKFECPSCLPEGTKVITPNGLENIEDVEVVHSVDENFNIIDKKVNVIKTGKKKIWEINTVYKSLYSSKDHKWIVYRDGMTKVIQTKDIKNGDIIYGINNNEMQSMWEKDTTRINKEEKKNVQLELQKDSGFLSTEEWRKDEDRRKENDKTIPKWSFDGAYCDNIIYESQVNKEKANKVWNYNKNLERTMYNICEKFKYIQAWKKMWGEGIQENSERELQMDMQQMWRYEEQNKGTFSSSQGWKSFKQFSNEFRSSMRFVPYKVTSLRETEEEVEMYDLQVPDTNNFILEGGVITHNCGTIISILQVEKEQKMPSKCSCGRKGGFKSIQQDMVDSQVIVVEESSDNLEDGGDQPKRINILLQEDLTDPNMSKKISPGSRVKIIGILKEVKLGTNANKPLTRYDLIIEANNVIPMDESIEDKEVTEEDEKEIRELATRPDLMEYLGKSIAPSVYGNEEIKKALTLQLFGGVSMVRSDGSFCREQIHGLLVGDPGVAKSVILKYLQEVSYKSRYVSGKSASGVGLTATVVKDELTGGYALEAGAMVLANKGSLFIDEFEKMSEEDRSNLHEGMSLGTISVSKASVQAKLNARTSILAAANPKFGRFDISKPFASQINLAPSLLSRFDFIFVMRDVPEEIRDSMIADKIFGEHSTTREDDILSKDMFKKYVAFAKSYHPKMGASALKILKEYYINLRNKTKVVDGKKVIPIGARQLEGLIRFAEASAKIRLRKTIITEDANIAIEVMESYLKEIGYDKKNDTFDVDAIEGNGIQSRSKVGLVMNAIKILTKELGTSVEVTKIKSALSSSIDSDEIDTVIEKLIRNGEAFRPTRGIIQLM